MARTKTFTNGGNLFPDDLNAMEDYVDSQVSGLAAYIALHQTNITSLQTAQTALTAAGPKIGFVDEWAGAGDPSAAWMLCDGRLLSRTVYAALFTAIGTVWGAGDGSSTFAIPDLIGRVSVHPDPTGLRLLANRTLGATGGQERVGLVRAENGPHDHGAASGSTDVGHTHSFPGNVMFGDSSNHYAFASAAGPADISAHAAATGAAASSLVHAHTITSDGSGSPHLNMQPFAVLNKVIRVQ